MTYVVQSGDHPSYDSLTDLLTDGWTDTTTVLELASDGGARDFVTIATLRNRYEAKLERHLRTETNRSRTAERLLKRAEADIEALTERLHELEAENAALRLADEPRRRALLNELLEKFFDVRVDIT